MKVDMMMNNTKYAGLALVMLAAPMASYSADQYECILEPKMTVNLGSASEGLLEEVLVDRGDRIRKGQVLARLTSGVEKANVELSRARLEFSSRKSSRNDELASKELIAAIDKDEMETETRINQHALQKDEEMLRMRHVTSPLDGVVIERTLSPGEQVRQDKGKIMTIAQIDPLSVEVVIPASQYGSVKVGMMAEIYPEAPVKGSYPARVTVVDRVIDAASSTFGVRLELPNPDYKIPAGFKCRARFIRSKS